MRKLWVCLGCKVREWSITRPVDFWRDDECRLCWIEMHFDSFGV